MWNPECSECLTTLDHRHCAVVTMDMPDAGIYMYQNLVGI